MATTRIRIEIDDENGTHEYETTHGSVIAAVFGDSRTLPTVLGQIKEEQDPYPPT